MKDNMKIVYYGVIHFLTIITSIIFIATTTGMGIPLSFLVSGIGILVFTLVTKGKTPLALGLSGSYVAGVLAVTANEGIEYAVGGTILAGVIYVLFGIMIKYFPKILKLFTPTILSIAILLIALNLLPIGVSVVSLAPMTGFVTLIAVIVLSMSKKLSTYSFPIALALGTTYHAITVGLTPSLTSGTIEFITPQFSMFGFTSISVVAIAVLFEALSDTKLVADVMGTEYKPHRIIIGNGLATIVGGALGSSNPVTTYSESTGFLMSTKWFKWQSTIVAGLLLILLALIPQVSILVSYIPTACFGGLLLYLFSMIASHRISTLDLSEGNDVLLGIVALSLFFVSPTLIPSISPIAVAMIGLVITNLILNKLQK